MHLESNNVMILAVNNKHSSYNIKNLQVFLQINIIRYNYTIFSYTFKLVFVNFNLLIKLLTF